jgi:hypothetical protein
MPHRPLSPIPKLNYLTFTLHLSLASTSIGNDVNVTNIYGYLSPLRKGGLTFPVLGQTELHVDFCFPHRWRLFRVSHQLRHFQPALQHVEYLPLRQDHQQRSQSLQQEGIPSLQDLQTQRYVGWALPRKPGDSSRLASLQKPIMTFCVISHSCAKVRRTR